MTHGEEWRPSGGGGRSTGSEGAGSDESPVIAGETKRGSRAQGSRQARPVPACPAQERLQEELPRALEDTRSPVT